MPIRQGVTSYETQSSQPSTLCHVAVINLRPSRDKSYLTSFFKVIMLTDTLMSSLYHSWKNNKLWQNSASRLMPKVWQYGQLCELGLTVHLASCQFLQNLALWLKICEVHSWKGPLRTFRQWSMMNSFWQRMHKRLYRTIQLTEMQHHVYCKKYAQIINCT